MLLAIFDFPMLNVGLREVIDAEPDMQVIGEVHEPRRDARARSCARPADVVITECLPVRPVGLHVVPDDRGRPGRRSRR